MLTLARLGMGRLAGGYTGAVHASKWTILVPPSMGTQNFDWPTGCLSKGNVCNPHECLFISKYSTGNFNIHQLKKKTKHTYNQTCTKIYKRKERDAWNKGSLCPKTGSTVSVSPKMLLLLNVFQPVAHTPTLMKCLEKLLHIKGNISMSLDPHQLSHQQRMPSPLPPTLRAPLIVPNYVFSRLHFSLQNGCLSANNKTLNVLECEASNAIWGGIRGMLRKRSTAPNTPLLLHLNLLEASCEMQWKCCCVSLACSIHWHWLSL